MLLCIEGGKKRVSGKDAGSEKGMLTKRSIKKARECSV